MKKVNTFLSIFITLVIFSIIAIVFLTPSVFSEDDTNVPNVLGATTNEAIEDMQESNLNVEIIEIASYEERGEVIRTEPAIGRKVKENSTVKIYVSNGNLTVDVIDFTGSYYSQKKSELEAYAELNDLKIVTEEVINNDVPEGVIFEQYPTVGSKISKNDVIIIYISKNDTDIMLADMTNWTSSDVYLYSKENDLNIVFNYEYSSYVNGDHVITQSVNQGERIRKGSDTEIIVTISKGINTYSVPDFMGLDIDTALVISEIMGLDVNVVYINSNGVTDIVSGQSLLPGSSYIVDDTEVVLYVSY